MVILKSYAKVNLYLKVLAKTGNLHALDSFIVFAYDVYDTIHLYHNDLNHVDFVGEHSNAIDSYNNSVVNILRCFEEEVLSIHEYEKLNIKITIEKNIPSFAGLGGGSSNAAVVLNYLCNIYGVSDNIKKNIANKIGSDVYPCTMQSQCFFVSDSESDYSSTSIIKTCYDISSLYLLLIFPDIKGCTSKIFSYTERFLDFNKIDSKITNKHTNKHDLLSLEEIFTIGNDLEYIFSNLYPEINKLKTLIHDMYMGKRVLNMTGSGSTYFVVFDNIESAKRLQLVLYEYINSNISFEKYKVVLSRVM